MLLKTLAQKLLQLEGMQGFSFCAMARALSSGSSVRACAPAWTDPFAGLQEELTAQVPLLKERSQGFKGFLENEGLALRTCEGYLDPWERPP